MKEITPCPDQCLDSDVGESCEPVVLASRQVEELTRGGVCRNYGCAENPVELGFCQQCLSDHYHCVAARERVVREFAAGDIEIDKLIERVGPWALMGV